MAKNQKNDMALARVPLPEGTIDLTIGEPCIIKKCLEKTFEKFGYNLNFPLILDEHKYPPASGIDDLREFLTFKYGKPVVVANGAKQALSAAIYALKDKKATKIYVPKPYWLSFPVLIEKEGCKMVHKESEGIISLITAPNNPDSSIDYIDFKSDKPVIFDGAYYSEQYLPNLSKIEKKGDIHLVSCSKQYGLSGLRVGYAICETQDQADKMTEYMEITTMGTCTYSQKLLHNIESFFHNVPQAYAFFINLCKGQLYLNTNKLKQINPLILDPKDIKPYGMFSFLKKGKEFNLATEKAKVKIIEGEHFGDKTRARVSLGLEPKVFAEAIDKLNKSIV